jgi:hypothetical protein
MTTRDRYWLVVNAILMVSGVVTLYRHAIDWSLLLVMAAILLALSRFVWTRRPEGGDRK